MALYALRHTMDKRRKETLRISARVRPVPPGAAGPSRARVSIALVSSHTGGQMQGRVRPALLLHPSGTLTPLARTTWGRETNSSPRSV